MQEKIHKIFQLLAFIYQTLKLCSLNIRHGSRVVQTEMFPIFIATINGVCTLSLLQQVRKLKCQSC